MISASCCRAARDAGPADLSAAARCQSQGGHGVPQRRLQREEPGIPDEGEWKTDRRQLSNSAVCIAKCVNVAVKYGARTCEYTVTSAEVMR